MPTSRFSIIIAALLTCIALRAEDYRWIITYPNATSEWSKRLACGENKLVLKAQFIAITPRSDYKLIAMAVRPLTSYTTSWLIDTLQLWLNIDNYPGSIDPKTDSLVSQITNLSIPPQSTPTNRLSFNLPPAGISLTDTTTFFITMHLQNLHDTIPDNREITDQGGASFGLYLSRADNDIVVTPSQMISNLWTSSNSLLFSLRAQNLPIVLYNKTKSLEEDSVRFYPHWSSIDATAQSKNQRLTDLTFPLCVNLPHSNLISGSDIDLLTYASFKLTWDNTILQLDSMAFGDIWDNKQYNREGSGFGAVTIDPANARYSSIRFEGVVLDANNAVEIDYNDLAVFYFKVIKPGVSPLWLSDVTLLDQWGIAYHTYRKLYNEKHSEPRADAWAKFNLGDYCGTKTAFTAGYGDGQIDPLTDISLFANYLWLSKDSTNWYRRFDVGSPSNHDPDQLSPDDTTNFFDLLIIGANYYRTVLGEFNQKRVAHATSPTVLSLQACPQDATNLHYCITISAKNLTDLAAAHLLLSYEPNEWRLINIQAGNWLRRQGPQNLLLTAPQPSAAGIVDLNLLLFPRPISGSGDLLSIAMERLSPSAPLPTIKMADLRQTNCTQLTCLLQIEDLALPPQSPKLMDIYPNPFNPITHIKYSIPTGREGNYRLAIYDLSGKLIRSWVEAYHPAGQYNCDWDGRNAAGQLVASGVYIFSLTGDNLQLRQKVCLIR